MHPGGKQLRTRSPSLASDITRKLKEVQRPSFVLNINISPQRHTVTAKDTYRHTSNTKDRRQTTTNNMRIIHPNYTRITDSNIISNALDDPTLNGIDVFTNVSYCSTQEATAPLNHFSAQRRWTLDSDSGFICRNIWGSGSVRSSHQTV